MAENRTTSAPQPVALYKMAIGHYVSHALYVAAKLGVADQLADGPLSYEQVAAATETHEPSLRRMLRLLVSMGVFREEDDGKVALAPLGEFLRKGVPGSMRAMVLLFSGAGIRESWGELEYCVRTGEPAFRKKSPDATAFTSIAANPEQATVFDEAMATFAPATAMAVAASYDFSAFGTVVDVGGGNGSLLIGILNANPSLHGIVYDLPHAAEKASAQVEKAGVADRCRAIPGSFFESVPSGGDAYILKHVIHDWNDKDASRILANCRRVMKPNGKLLILEDVYPAHIDGSENSRGAAANDVNMLVCTGGRQRSEAEFRSLYESAGLRLTNLVPTPARLVVIEAVPV